MLEASQGKHPQKSCEEKVRLTCHGGGVRERTGRPASEGHATNTFLFKGEGTGIIRPSPGDSVLALWFPCALYLILIVTL